MARRPAHNWANGGLGANGVLLWSPVAARPESLATCAAAGTVGDVEDPSVEADRNHVDYAYRAAYDDQ